MSTPPVATSLVVMLVTGLLGMQPLSTDLYLGSLPNMADDFEVGAAAVQLTLSVFIGGFALAQLLAGPLSDRFGRRPIALAGCAVYLLACIASAVAPSLQALILARLLQSLGACAAVICARALVRDLYAPAEGARVMSRALGWMTAVPLLGPIAGSWLQYAFGWRANFVLMALAGALMLWFCWRHMPETNAHLNPRATSLSGLAQTYWRIARSADFRAYTLIAAGAYCALFTFLAGSSFVAVRVLGLPAQHFGLLFGSVTSGFLAGTLVTRRILPRLGINGTIRAGGLVTASAGCALALLELAGLINVYLLALPMFFVFFAHGLLQPTSQMGAMGPFPREAGAASALTGCCMSLGAVGTGLWVGASFDGTMRPLAFTVAGFTCLTALFAFGLLKRQAIPQH
jgi:DHA1 family bicyclomycin/chloramphenicol resistance-like MFS transporter